MQHPLARRAVTPGGSRPGHAGHEQFQVVSGGRKRAVFLRDALPLLREADIAAERPGRERLQEPVRRPGPAAHRAAAPVEKADRHPGLPARGGDLRLPFVQGPLAGQDAGVLVAVAIADHYLLHELGLVALLQAQAAARDGVIQEPAQDARAALEIGDGLEERDDGQQAGEPIRQNSG